MKLIKFLKKNVLQKTILFIEGITDGINVIYFQMKFRKKK